ncbi:MAG: DMT family transporter [Burkholderiaceae bacterium]
MPERFTVSTSASFYARHKPTLVAILFTVIWSTGFIVARAIKGEVDPSLFLTIRFALCIAMFALITVAMGLPWPRAKDTWRLIGIGGLMQGLYLGPGFWAVGQGLQPGLWALVCALQPPLTAAFASRYFGDKLKPLAWVGLLLGLAGVALAVWPHDKVNAVPLLVVSAAFVSMLSITVGTLLQKTSVSHVHLIPASAIQNIGATIVVAMMAVALGETHFVVNTQTLLALGYAVFVLSLGGPTLLMWLVREGSATRATSLLYLVPVLSSLMAYYFFGDALSLVQIVGFVIAIGGVILARRSTTK